MDHLIEYYNKLPESGDLFGNITKFGVAEGSSESCGLRWSTATQTELILPYRSPDERLFCFYILLFNDFMLFPANIYEINMYLSKYLSFKISGSIVCRDARSYQCLAGDQILNDSLV